MTDYLAIYQKMVLARTLESKFLELAKTTGELSDLHLNRGEEAISIGVTSVLRPNDYMVTSHRVISHYLGKGGDIQRLTDEILGRATGICGGKANEMHIRDHSIGFEFAFQLVGTQTPTAAGIAWASRYVLKEDRVVVLFTGDASTSNAQFLEGLNAAALRKVPLLVCITDNHLAGNITPNYYLPENTSIGDRFAAFGIGSIQVDGNKIDEVVKQAQFAVDLVRSSSKPLGLICDTTRLLMHKIGQGDIRTSDQIAELAKRDPIIYAQKLLNLTESQITEIQDTANLMVTEAIDKAHAAPYPEPDAALLQQD